MMEGTQDKKNMSSFEADMFQADVKYADFDFDNFLYDCGAEPNLVTQQLPSDFESLAALPQILPTLGSTPSSQDRINVPGAEITQDDMNSFQNFQGDYYDISPFETSLLSFDNADSCFSFTFSTLQGGDTDSLMLDTEQSGTTEGSPVQLSTSTTIIANTNTEAPRARRPNSRFPRSSVQVLEHWLSTHSSCPYPSDSDKDALKTASGLKRSQIASWFANARKRRKVKPPQPPTIETVPEQPILDLPNIEKIHPFDRWRLSPVGYEACAPAAILEAILSEEERPWDPVKAQHYSHTKSTRSKATSVYSGYLGPTTASVSSMASMEIRPNRDIDFNDDTQSQRSSAFPETVVRRRRRRTLASSTRSTNASIIGLPKRFQCTFCSEPFARKHDWQRHEKSQHLPLESWSCSPHGSVNVNPATNEITCVFCDSPDPTPEHIQEHGYGACIKRFPAERTFYRKDHLRQHLRLMHGNSIFINSMKSWSSCASEIHSRCGFCDKKFQNWADRSSHIAEHYGNGLTMAEWRGDWGFEPHVEKILERATLPQTTGAIAAAEFVTALTVNDQLHSFARSKQSDALSVTLTRDSSDWREAESKSFSYPGYPFNQDFGFEGLQEFYAATEAFTIQMNGSKLN